MSLREINRCAVPSSNELECENKGLCYPTVGLERLKGAKAKENMV